MSTPNNPAEVLRAYIKEIVPAEELPSDFDARMDAWAAYCDELVEIDDCMDRVRYSSRPPFWGIDCLASQTNLTSSNLSNTKESP